MSGEPRQPSRRPTSYLQAPGFSWQNALKSAPPAPPLFVLVPPPVLLGVVCVGGAVPPPVFDGVVVTGGVAEVPPLLDVELDEDELELGVAVVVVEVVVVAVEDEEDDDAGVPPDGGAVSAGGAVGTL